MKFRIGCTLVNSWNEYEDGAELNTEKLSEVIDFMETTRLSGSPDCSWSDFFEYYNNDGVVVANGTWSDLRKLISENYFKETA